MEQAIDAVYDESREPELIRQAQRERDAFRPLYERWVTPVYKYLYHRLGSQADAEDLTSQTFLQAYQALPRFRPGARFSAWLFTIAHNLLRDFYRKSGREMDLDAAGELAGADLSEENDRNEEVLELTHLFARLSEDERELLRLRYAARLSFADIAGLLGKRQDAVKKSLYRLQERLQSMMEVNHD